ncbi:MAG: hypothetical protein Q7U88_08515 [Desulfocapsaceae bacterium]|nr:hypothetical protein [Desulfocapsaceae bacterium]
MRAYATSLIFGAQKIKPKYYMADLDSKVQQRRQWVQVASSDTPDSTFPSNPA